MYPPIEPYRKDFLKVSELHTLYFEEVGNPKGIPLVLLHGGPGGGVCPEYRQFFNPEKYRIVLFDQRGCGKSTPHACLEENTTWDLVADIEKLRNHLGISSWAVFGGSWGSTLALCYAVTHVNRVKALFLRGIFLVRRKEIAWFYQEGASRLFPDFWQEYIAPIPYAERDQLLRAYYTRLRSESPELRLEVARTWSQWEASTSRLQVNQQAISEFEEPHLALAFARIECHYFVHDAWIPSDQWLLEQVQEKLTKTPCYIVHGRYDVVCPIESAWDLKKAMPHAEFKISPNAGHSMMESENQAQLIQWLDEWQAF